MAKRRPKKESLAPSDPEEHKDQQEAEPPEAIDYIAGIAELPTEQALNKLIRGLAALHRSFKEYREKNDARYSDLENVVTRLARISISGSRRR